MDTPTEAPAAAPVVTVPTDLSLDEIVAQELASADAAGAPVLQEQKPADAPKTETPPTGDAPATEDTTPAAAPATEAPAEEPKIDDVTARRVRTMLAAIEQREQALAARESAGLGDTLAELLRSPKAFLAKHGKSIDDVIDASIAEGKDPPAEAPVDDRITKLERRIAERDERDQQAAISNRKAEIHRDITAASAKYPALVAANRQSDVTDFMVEYHSIHGKAISWDKAAALVEKDLTGVGIAVAKKLGWNAPAPKPAATPATPAAERPGTVSIGGEQRSAAPTTGDEPEDPEQLMKFLVAQAGL